MTQDTKMIIGVAALVVTGAAGLAALGVLGSLHQEQEAQPAPDPRVSVLPASTQPSRPVIQPAVTENAPEGDRFDLDIPDLQAEPACDAAGDTGRIARGLAHWESAAYAEAAACFGDEVDAGSERPWVHYMLGLSLWKGGEPDRAAAAMIRAAELDDQSVKTFINLSRIQNDRGEYDQALEAAQEALSIEPDNPTALFLKGRSLRNQGLRAEALDALMRSADLDPANGYARNLLGLTLLEADRETEALPFLKAAADLLPEVSYVFNNLGMAQERCGRRGEALAAYRRAVELDGGRGHGARNLARLDPQGTFEPPIEVAEATD